MELQDSNSVKVGIEAFETLYYANAMSGLPFISRLAISSTRPLTDITVRLSVVSAGGPVSRPFEIQIATLGAKLLEYTSLRVSFDSNKMFQIADPQEGKIEVSVSAGGSDIGEFSWPIRVLPANYWRAGGVDQNASYQALAAFSQPNHPSVRQILDSALEKMTSVGAEKSFSGYQNPAQVDPMVQGIYSAIQSLGLTYSNPPASWSGGPGQKVRTTQEVLQEKVGTCLDTTMLMASALEQVGLAPLIFLIPGHAFVGYWSGEYSMKFDGWIPSRAPLEPIDSLATFIDLGLLKLVETTALTSDVSFSDAQIEAKARLEAKGAYGSGKSDSVAIDILSCRRSDVPIHPLPARFVNESGSVEIVEYHAPVVDLDVIRAKFAERDAVAGMTVSLKVPPMVRKWLDSLLDLSLRNPLINFSNKRTATRLLVPTGSLGDLEDWLQSDKEYELRSAPSIKGPDGTSIPIWSDNQRGEVPADPELENFLNGHLANPRGLLFTEHQDPDTFLTRMRRTASEAKSILQETGSNGLFLALGSLSWTVPQGDVESPLILIPVTLTPKNRGKSFMLALEESGVTPNFSLVEKLKIEHKINLDGLANLATDKFGIDIDGTIKYVREELVKAGLNDFKVNASATLGFFNFSSYRLWKDLLDNWEGFEKNPLVKHLIHTPGEAFVDPVQDDEPVDLDALVAELPISADGSQAEAIASALKGKTFVLQGPPGTGKSQTITNLLAKALDSGKRVLFVAEKRDALDVVKSRIDAAGLGAFSLDLHDKNSTSKAVKAQLAEVIDIMIEADKVGFDGALQDYSAALAPLRKYKSQIHDVDPLGESVFSSLDKFLAINTDFRVTIPGSFISDANQELVSKVREALKSAGVIGPSAGIARTNPWSLVGREDEISQEELSRLRELVSDLEGKLNLLAQHPAARNYLESSTTIEQLEGFEVARLEPVKPELANFFGSTESHHLILDTQAALTDLRDKLANVGHDLSRVEKVDFDALDNQYRLALATNFLVRGMKVGAVAKMLNIQLGLQKHYGKSDLPAALEKLSEIQAATKKLRGLLERYPAAAELGDESIHSTSGIDELTGKIAVLDQLDEFLQNPPIDKSLAISLLSELNSDQRQAAGSLADSLKELTEILQTNERSMPLWTDQATLGAKLLATISDLKKDATEFNYAQLVRWVALNATLAPLRESGLEGALDSVLSGQVPFDDAARAFEKSYFENLFNSLLVRQGLNTFDGSMINNYIRKLNEAHEGLRKRLPKILGAELLSRRGFDGSMRVGAIGDLVLSVKQGRSNIPLRELLAKHWPVISKMTPCVLASPDSAVRFLKSSLEPFDLVVFDEASQIRVANSIGALGRAKAAVVVGDSQQMPPTSVAVTKIGPSDEDVDIEEEQFGDAESILTQCETARVPDIMLTWHYRSEDESLIAFSNHEYYEGKLSTFPTPRLKNSERRLSLKTLEHGQFIRSAGGAGPIKGPLRTNPVEAHAIVEDVIARLTNPETKDESIAIVTLNEQQKVYVEQLMSQSESKVLQEALEKGVGGEEILVKALEKVQGSERDVVLLSVAFSPKAEDRSNLPLNFGPIMYQGGHKRLNVAITRARKEVKVFSSFKPKLLADRRPTARGLIDLANFMQMAEGESANAMENLAAKESRLDRYRAEVASVLRAAGLNVIEEVGLSEFKVDLAIADSEDADRAVLGILLDGSRWHVRKTVNDRDSLPVSMLTSRMGWPGVERIWLPNWLRDKQGEVQKIKKAFEAAKLVKPAPSRKSLDAPTAEPIYVKKADLEDHQDFDGVNPLDDLLDSIEIWSELRPGASGSPDDLDRIHDPKVKDYIRYLADQLTGHEGPVSSDRLAKFVASCFGLSRVANSRASAILGIGFPGHPKDKDGFVYPKTTDPANFTLWRRAATGQARGIQTISIPEISAAMVDIARAAHGIAPEQLAKETSRAFGVQKVSKDALERLKLAMGYSLARGALVEDGPYLKAV